MFVRYYDIKLVTTRRESSESFMDGYSFIVSKKYFLNAFGQMCFWMFI